MKQKLNDAAEASKKVYELVHEAEERLKCSRDLHTSNGYGILMKPRLAWADIACAVDSLKKAMELIDKTSWLTEADYDQL